MEEVKKTGNVILGVTGGIAAYKACELSRLLVKAGHSVTVVMTKNAQEFVTPLTFSTLTGNDVVTGMYDSPARTEHIDIAEMADLVIVAPATANVIGKVAGGIADDMLSTVIMATVAPVIFCPAMNVNMFENPIVKENMAKLRQHGYLFVEPTEGELACGVIGTGRMAEPQEIMAAVSDIFAGDLKKGGAGCDLAGLRVMVTAGPTREAIDSVRYITNHSTGKMGFAVARRAKSRGADVVLITGPSSLVPPAGVEMVRVTSAADMGREVNARFDNVDAVIKAAAVADVTPLKKSDHKLKKEECGEAIKLGRTEDILKGLGKIKGEKILVGFAAETRDLMENAERKLREKNLDLIVINDVSRTDAGFGADTNEIKIIDVKGEVDSPPLMMKEGVAEYILDRVKEIWLEKRKGKN